MVKAEDSWSRGCGFKPGTVYWMDVSDALAITYTKIMKIKVAKWGTPKKYLKNAKTTLDITIKKALVELTFLALLYCLNEVRQF